MWMKTGDLIKDIQDARSRLISGETSVEGINAEARLFGEASRVLRVAVEHARITGRLKPGDDTLPEMKF